MYMVGASDFVLIAHSLRGEVFGPAQRLHGATYEVRVEVRASDLDANGIIMDFGLLRDALAQALAPLAYQNLDELPAFVGRNSTTEVLCRHIHDALRSSLPHPAKAELRVTLVESPVAWAYYEAPLS